MVDLQFVDQHNMVSCLKRSDENVEFHQIFWATAKSKTVNDVKQIHATVDGKIVVISESSVRSNLHFNDEDVDGEGSRQPSKPQPPSSTAPPSQVTTVATQHQKTHKLRRAKREDDRVVRAATTASSIEAEQKSDTQTRFETASKKSYDPPLSKGNTSGNREDSIEHQVDLTDFAPPTPHDSPLSGVLPLENSKTAQDLVIQKLKKRVKRLEKVLRARTPGMKLFKIGTSKRKGLAKENVSKQGRKSDKTKPMFNDSDFDVLDDAMKNVEGGSIAEQITIVGDTLNTASINVSASGPSHVSTTGPSNVSVAGPSTSTVGDIFEDEMTTIANTLVGIRSARPTTTSVMIHNVKEEPMRVTPVPKVQSQDKDELLAKILQQEEREQFTVDEQARIDDNGKKDDSSSKQAESSKKRPRAEHDEESVKKQKLEDDAER
ncbi:hypothetical protein Tco_1155912 [Tanacetum coccineum]